MDREGWSQRSAALRRSKPDWNPCCRGLDYCKGIKRDVWVPSTAHVIMFDNVQASPRAPFIALCPPLCGRCSAAGSSCSANCTIRFCSTLKCAWLVFWYYFQISWCMWHLRTVYSCQCPGGYHSLVEPFQLVGGQPCAGPNS